MDVREKLVELLLKEDDVCKPNECKDCGANGSCYYHRAANRIIANGVTVQECTRPLEEWHEDYGDVLWWKFPIEEPPYVGSPLDEKWPAYHTHWTPIVLPQPPKGE